MRCTWELDMAVWLIANDHQVPSEYMLFLKRMKFKLQRAEVVLLPWYPFPPDQRHGRRMTPFPGRHLYLIEYEIRRALGECSKRQ